MAVFDSVLVLPNQPATKLSVNASTASSEVAFGPQVVVAINADQDIMIRAGAAGAVATPTSSDFRIPSGVTFVFMTDRNAPSFKLFNNGASSANIYIQRMSQF